MSESVVGLLVQVVTLLALVLANGFFVAAEFSLVTVRRTRVEQLVRSGHRGARLVSTILQDLDSVISSTQLGITMASLALGWMAEPFLALQMEGLLSFLPSGVIGAASHTLAAAMAFAIITYLHIVLGELAPKTLALQRAEATALAVAAPMLLFARVFSPFVRLLNGSGNRILRVLGVHGPSTEYMIHSEEELRMILNQSQESGVLEEQETEIIQRVFDFTDIRARHVMVPRMEMVCLPLAANLDEVLEIVLQQGHTRYPVFNSGLDDIVGVVQVQDIMPAMCGQRETFDVKAIMRAPLIVPETIHVDDVLSQFRRHKTHMAVLVDEFGGTAGLVTMMDLLEEIVGDVSDEHDQKDVQMEEQTDGSYLINGKTKLGELNERFDLDLRDPHYVTLAGFVFGQIGRRPRIGDETTAGGMIWRVEELDGLRIARLRMTPKAQDEL